MKICNYLEPKYTIQIMEKIIHSCDQKDCNFETKKKSNLKRHLWEVHSVGHGDIHSCDQMDCNYETKSKGDLKRHLWEVHSLGHGDIHSCDQKDCNYETKSKGHLKRHLSSTHDIGDVQCDCCVKNVYSVTKYTDPKTKKESMICRKCYRKATGFKTRSEKEMVEYLQSTPEISPYMVQNDKILKGDACNTLRRPDCLIASTKKLNIILECDEKQHSHYLKECEDGRIDEILDELPEGRTIIIRWNPDNYKPPTGVEKKKRKQRHEMLKDLILNIVSREDFKDEETILVFYMFYSENHPNITTRWKTEIIY